MLPNDSQRPDPDALLAQVQAQEKKASRGKLRIYFGASAGVGKTCAMLAAAHKMQDDGQQLLVGIVETHGRRDTAALLEGLPLLPLKQIVYRGKNLAEFDLDEALLRRPPLILMDELAHSNAPGSRHPKRWQDVEELLDAGIDVLSTVNVQHLESLNDVVGGITGVRVAETLPDTVFDRADEVVLVDLPADELLTRLKLGKVYQPQQAERASQNFFRKGNLIALRELALRRTADRIQDDVQAYRVEKSINPIWKTGAALLACIGPRPGAEHVIRSTARLASQLNAEWHALYVETPQLQHLPPAERERILKTLKLAQDLGARTAVVSNSDIAGAIVDYARAGNISKVIVGRGRRNWPWRIAHARRIAQLAPDVDLIEIGQPAAQAGAASQPAARDGEEGADAGRRPSRHWRYLVAAGASVLTALLVLPMLAYLDLANIAMLFLLTVVLVAVRFGRGPAALASLVGVACFDFVFVPPRYSFAVGDFQYVITFGVMLAVGLIIGHLTAGLRFQARVASHREARARALYEFARELSGVLQTEQIFEITRDFIQRAFQARATLLIPDDDGRLQMTQQAGDIHAQQLALLDLGIAQWSFDHAEAAGIGTDTLPAASVFYLPLIAPMRTRGILALLPDNRRWLLVPEQRQHLDTFAALAAIALERVHYIDVAQGALVQMESERLRNSLLAALSHDLRTPLTSLVGLSESLVMSKPGLAPEQLTMARSLQEETLRMSALVSNLLDMARIESGQVRLNLQWQALEEVVGSALRASRSQLTCHQVQTRLERDLPLVSYDAVLIERVLCNLLENAAKYTPPGSSITIAADVRGAWLQVSVYDDGPGLPAGREEAIFEKFTRGERESNKPGVGLGLAICRAIVEAHGGKIRAGQSPIHGAAIEFTLPLGTPPAMPELDLELPH
ncbi:two-component system sensor histidine kinase KdpD [Janthinobacterium agaricidamnosum]|uniref:histidine kinase n=1 Tax=Janthinobacterium agaricidamnosum NBRC 102515 = DSM 9628 TaxID=1349767 RepID=W0UXS5_9BURK|nr:two-component system sensor histidine kinase KdpD [Janthinobacterium agaricidamnosum]CDG81354.1 sensor protein kdpD [Janthinobacterium agaricidamnosum NBRC 102515 = DSM 9628]